jgi:hypothetical protein
MPKKSAKAEISPRTAIRRTSSFSVIFRTLRDPRTNHLNRAVGKIRTSLRHPIAERRVRREFFDKIAVIRFTRDNGRTVSSTSQNLRLRIEEQTTTPAVTSETAMSLKNRPDVVLERNLLCWRWRRGLLVRVVGLCTKILTRREKNECKERVNKLDAGSEFHFPSQKRLNDSGRSRRRKDTIRARLNPLFPLGEAIQQTRFMRCVSSTPHPSERKSVCFRSGSTGGTVVRPTRSDGLCRASRPSSCTASRRESDLNNVKLTEQHHFLCLDSSPTSL